MRRSWLVWLCFSLCLAIAAGALGWLSVRAWQLDRADAQATAQAALEESARLALWRMDSQLSALVAQESARRAVGYNANELDAMLDFADPAISVALRDRRRQVVLHFELDESDTWQSADATANRTTLDDPSIPTTPTDARAALARLQGNVRFADLAAALPTAPVPLMPDLPTETQIAQLPQQSAGQQALLNRGEFRARSAVVAQNSVQRVAEPAPAAPAPIVGAMTPLWLGERLILARRAVSPGRTTIQGCLLDWPLVRSDLIESIRDLLPNADLVPAPGAGEAEGARLLAALPVRLVAAPAEPAVAGGMTPMRWSLLGAWASLALAAAAAAVVLRGVLALSERRAAFVSAVTHELRTPLTTFRLYAEMLAEGMVASDADRRRYLNTLRVEADRLTHLVENVLAYARLERGGLGGRKRSIRVDELVSAAGQRLHARAEQSQLDLQVALPDEVAQATAVADPGAVEQVLFNLVDNACKYAATAADRRVHLDVRRINGHVELRVRDHGPGVSPAQQRVLFQPFRKSAEEAAVSAPGVGLGLALSRRLALQMGGRLVLDESADGGACFVLTLPLAAAGNEGN